MAKNWNEAELLLGILQVISSTGQKASGKVIMDYLDLQDVSQLQTALHWLIDQQYVEVGQRAFLITGKGRNYLDESKNNGTYTFYPMFGTDDESKT